MNEILLFGRRTNIIPFKLFSHALAESLKYFIHKLEVSDDLDLIPMI